MEIYLAILAGTGGMFGWGIADFLAKKTVDSLGDLKTLLWSQIFGLLPMTIFLLLNWGPANLGSNIVPLLILFGAGDLLGYFLFYRGLQKGLVSILAPVFAAQSGVAIIVSAFIFGEVISSLRWSGLTAIFIGIILVAFQPEKSGKLTLRNISKGMPEVLIGMLIYGFFFPCWDWFLEYQDKGWIVADILSRAFLVVILLLAIYIYSSVKKTPMNVSVKKRGLWAWLVLIGLFDAIASLSTAWGYRFTSMTSVIVALTGAAPLPTVILARIFLKEKLIPSQMAGIIGIVGGLIILAI